MLEALNLKKVYKPKAGMPVYALDDVSVKLPETGMVFILGKSGSGKSTLLNVLGGLDSFDSGEIFINGKSAKDFRQSHYDSYRNTYIGFIFQEYNILEEFTVGANIALAIELQGRKATDEEINEILNEVDLVGHGSRKPNELSGGQKQRVAIARALVKKPQIIMADEPTGALDSKTGRAIFDTLKKLSREKLVLIVSHDREFAELYADRIIELADGKIISDMEKQFDDGYSEEEEKNLVYEGNQIQIKSGYSLTEEDRNAINRYIANLKTDAMLSIDLSEKGQKKGFSFVDTKQERIDGNRGGFELIKSKLSIKNAFKIGSSSLGQKKFKLVMTIFLSFIAFTLFGLADTIASYDNIKTCTSSLMDSNITYAAFEKQSATGYSTLPLADEDLAYIEEKAGVPVVGVYQPSSVSLSFKDTISSTESYEKAKQLYSDTFSGIATLPQDLSKYGYSLVAGGATLDGTKKEVVISKYMADNFIVAKAKFKEYTDDLADSSELTIENYNDLIGKRLLLGGEQYRIVGILDTGFKLDRYQKILEIAEKLEKGSITTTDLILSMVLCNELDAARNYSFDSLLFFGDGYINRLISENHQFIYEIPNTYQYDFHQADASQQYYFSRMAPFNEVKDHVHFFDSAKTELQEGDIVIPASSLSQFASFSTSSNDLQGFEKDVYEGVYSSYNGAWTNSLEDFINDYTKYADLKYATTPSNYQTVLNWVKTNYGNEDVVSSWSKDYVISYYLWETHPENSAYQEQYYQSLLSTYSFEEFLLSDTVKNSLYASKTGEDETDFYENFDKGAPLTYTKFLDNYRSILIRKYVLEHWQETVDYYDTQYGAGEHVYVPVYYLADCYFNHLYGSSDTAVQNYVMSELIGIVKDIPTLASLEMTDFYNEDAEPKTFRVVGILDDGNDQLCDPYLFVSDDATFEFFTGGVGAYSFAVGAMPKTEFGIRKAVNFAYNEFREMKTLKVRYPLQNSVTYELDMISEILTVLGNVFLYVGIGFAVFASLMLSNYISISVNYKKHEIGILRAIGSRSNDVFLIFFAESFIIAMINFVLSIAGTVAVTIVINNVLRTDVGILITVLNFGIRQIGLILAVSLFVAFIATLLPVKRIASKRPIDAIRGR